MAYDKIVDSSALDANLTSVANAIREKGGTSDKMAFPAGFVEAISAIEAGGANVKTGSFTPSSNAQYLLGLEHNLNKMPTIVIIVGDTVPLKTPNYAITAAWAIGENINIRAYCSSAATTYVFLSNGGYSMQESYDKFSNKSSTFFNANEKTIDIGTSEGNSMILCAGVTYYWFIM